MLAIRSKNAVSDIGPAVDSRLKTAHSTRSARGVAALSRSSGSASHQRSGSISVRRRWVGRPSSSRMSASRRSTGSGSASRSAAWRRMRLIVPGGDAADSGRDAGDGPLVPRTASGASRSSPDASRPGGRPSYRSSAAGRRRDRRDGSSSRSSSMAGRSSSDRRSSASSAEPATPAGVSGRAGQPAQLPGPVQPDEDLAEQPLEAGRLAAGAQRLDRVVGHRPRRVGGRERSSIEAFRWREQALGRDEVRVARAAGHGSSADVRPGPRPGWQPAAGRQQLDDGRPRPRRDPTAAR